MHSCRPILLLADGTNSAHATPTQTQPYQMCCLRCQVRSTEEHPKAVSVPAAGLQHHSLSLSPGRSSTATHLSWRSRLSASRRSGSPSAGKCWSLAGDIASGGGNLGRSSACCPPPPPPGQAHAIHQNPNASPKTVNPSHYTLNPAPCT